MYAASYNVCSPGSLKPLKVIQFSFELENPQPDADGRMWFKLQTGVAPIYQRVFKNNAADILVWANGQIVYELYRNWSVGLTYAKGTCQTCGSAGSFVRMALVCKEHGAFGGI